MAEVTLPLWVEYAKALGPTFVALVAACIAGTIAYRQWRTAQNKLKLDLFDRRLALFKSAQEFIEESWPVEEPFSEAARRIARELSAARWLLDTAANRELEVLVVRVRERIALEKAAGPMLEDAPLRQIVGVKYEEMRILSRIFSPFLNIRH